MDSRNFEYPTGNSGIDGKAYNIELVIGGDFANGRGNATVYATWRENEELLQGATRLLKLCIEQCRHLVRWFR